MTEVVSFSKTDAEMPRRRSYSRYDEIYTDVEALDSGANGAWEFDNEDAARRAAVAVRAYCRRKFNDKSFSILTRKTTMWVVRKED